MKIHLSQIIRPFVVILAIGAFAAPAVQAGPMVQAGALTQQAHSLLKDDATRDKGGHRLAAMKLLKQALDEINAGIEYDRTHTGPNENKKRKP